MHMFKNLLAVATPILLAGCTAMTSLSATHPDAKVTIASSKAGTAVPRSETLPARSFGNYEFRADAPGKEPFYGILPLKFNGGYLALDILFFTPAMFFNLREVYPYYEFDLEKRQVRYKQKPEEEWNIFVPLQSDTEQGKQVLGPKPADDKQIQATKAEQTKNEVATK